MRDPDFAQSLSNDLRVASGRVDDKANDPLNDKTQREREATAEASAIAETKRLASAFCQGHLQGIFETLQDTVLSHGYHVTAHNVEEHADASGRVGKRLAAGRNTDLVASVGYAPEFLTAGVTSSSERGGIVFRHEQIFTVGQFKEDAVALWFLAQLRQAVVVMVQVGALVKTTAGSTK